MELAILNLLSTKKNYDRYVGFIKKHTVTQETYTIVGDLKKWYEKHHDVDWKTFTTWFKFIQHPSFTPDQANIYTAIFAALEKFTPSSDDIEVVHAMVGRDYAAQIAITANDIADGKKGSIDDIEAMVHMYNTDVDKAKKVEDMFVTDDITELMEAVYTGPGLDWRLNELNKCLGPLRRGDFITFAARPDSGKTTMLASEATYLTEQTGDKVTLWFCNEESGKKVKLRVIQSALGITLEDFNKDVAHWYEEYEKLMGGYRIKVIHNSLMSVHDVETILDHYGEDEVGLIIFDQLWKMHGFSREAGNEVSRQGMLFAWGRAVAERAPVINVHQADAAAEGQLFIEMNQLYGSKTAIQGECDAIVTLGRSHDPAYAGNTRGLYAPKNKLVGGPGVDPSLANARFEVQIQPTIARYTGAL